MPQVDDADERNLKQLTLDELHAARNDLLRMEREQEAKVAGPAVLTKYYDTLEQIQNSIRDLENAELMALLKQLEANERDLKNGIEDLQESLARIDKIESVLKNVSKVLKVVGKVMKFLA